MITFTGMVIPEAKDWVGVLAPTASAFAAITALAVSLWVAHAQRQLTRTQIKQSLYEKRYTVFLAAEDFLMHLLRVNGAIELPSEEFRKFHYAAEQTGFLFGREVVSYMDRVKKAALDLHPKAFERDHLAAMNQQKVELNLEITTTLMEIGGPLVEMRKRVFSPYLQLNESEIAEGSAVPMKLNGWQRLWVLVLVLWLVPVALFSYADWPTAASISKGDVYYRMKPEDGHRLTDYYDVMASRLGGTNVVAPRIAELRRDKDFMAASTSDQKAYLTGTEPDFAKASPLDQNAYLGHITGVNGPTVDIGGHTVTFIRDVPQQDINQTVVAYGTTLRQLLTGKRVSVLGSGFAFWVIPAIVLYALGLGIWWVRRGFSTSTN